MAELPEIEGPIWFAFRHNGKVFKVKDTLPPNGTPMAMFHAQGVVGIGMTNAEAVELQEYLLASCDEPYFCPWEWWE